MGYADDGHAPLLQDFGDFRNGGAGTEFVVVFNYASFILPLLEKLSIFWGKIIAINGILAFCHRINKNILIVWNICPKCSAAAGKVRSQGAGIPFGKKYENVFSRRRQSADIAGVPFLLRRSTQRHIQHHHDTESYSKKQGPDVGVFSL